MSDQPLLSDLCSICNTNKSKYRCPGCSARTCSLPCYKRHQQWAQCSGQRDPAKFVKKSQLVTPAGIDHDYNFLSGIERDIEKAEKAFAEASDSVPVKPRGFTPRKGQINYQQLEAAGVKVIRAPKGMSRQKENKSHRSSTKKSTGGQNIVWTVEWLGDQEKRTLTETSSTCQLAAAHPFAHGEQYKTKKRKHDGNDSAQIESSSQSQNAKNTPEDYNKSLKLDDKVVTEEQLEPINQEREQLSFRQRIIGSNAQANEESETQVAETHPSDSGNDGSNPQPLRNEQRRFYLVKPRTSSSKHVLIPLDPSATLGQSLQGRTVLEFPTIYVFPESMQQLPEEFMLEEDYLKQESEEQKEFNDLISELDPEILRRLQDNGRPREQHNAREPEVDDKAILDVLKKDFGSQI